MNDFEKAHNLLALRKLGYKDDFILESARCDVKDAQFYKLVIAMLRCNVLPALKGEANINNIPAVNDGVLREFR